MKIWPHLQRVDDRLMTHAARRRSRALDGSLVRITKAASYSRLWLLIASALMVFGAPIERKAARRGLIAVAIAAMFSNGPAKLLVRRRRPSRSLAPLIRMPRSTSFPSGHSATAFAFATAVSAECPKLAPALLPLAGTVAYSRVHAGVHYPSDVAAGIAIGIASGLLAGANWRRIPSRLP